MLVWALAVLHELNPGTWSALLDVIAAAPADSLDEVSTAGTSPVFAQSPAWCPLHRGLTLPADAPLQL